jgi:hypothetical protein
MDRSYVAENAVERARLKAIVARLTDADLANMAKCGHVCMARGRG